MYWSSNHANSLKGRLIVAAANAPRDFVKTHSVTNICHLPPKIKILLDTSGQVRQNRVLLEEH